MLAKLSIPVMFSFHVIVLASALYVPPAKSDFDSSIVYGSVSTIITSASPIYVSTFAVNVIVYGIS